MPKNQFIGEIVFGTVRAVLFQDNYWHHPQWLPRSQIDIEATLYTSEVIIKASDWICGAKNIKEFEEIVEEPEGW